MNKWMNQDEETEEHIDDTKVLIGEDLLNKQFLLTGAEALKVFDTDY